MKIYFTILMFFSVIACKISAQEFSIDSISAIVNNQIILHSDVNEMVLFLKQKRQKFPIPFKIDFLKHQALNKLINEALILDIANKMNIVVDRKQTDAFIKDIALKNHVSVLDLKENIIKHNISYENYKKRIEKLIKMQIVENYILNKRIDISDNQINCFLKKEMRNREKLTKLKLSYILISVLQEDKENIVQEKKILAKKMFNAWLKHQNLKYLSKKYNSKKNIFLIKQNFSINMLDMKEHFSNIIEPIKIGDIIGPTIGKNGFYIFQIHNIKKYKENIKTEFDVQNFSIKSSMNFKGEKLKKHVFNIYKNLKKGIYSFDYAVKNLSNDFEASYKKGHLGWIVEDSLSNDLKKIFLKLNINDISKPIQSNHGWNIIKVLDKRKIDMFYIQTREQIYHFLWNKHIKSEKKKWIKELKNHAYIKKINS